jgi:hypothetical protein
MTLTQSCRGFSPEMRQLEFPKIYNPCLALDKATHTLLEIFRNPILLNLFERTSDKMIISFSSP